MFAALLLLALSAQAQQEDKEKRVSCGIVAVESMASYIGAEQTDEKMILWRQRWSESDELSMQDLIKAAAGIGLELVGRKGDLDDACSGDTPFIAYVKPGHFLLVTASNNDWVQVIDNGEPGLISRKQLRENSGGLYLFPLRSAKCLRVMQNPIITVKPLPDTPPTHTFVKFTNPTDSPLLLKIASPQCGCMEGGTEVEIPPGKRLQVLVDLSKSKELKSNKPVHLPFSISKPVKALQLVTILMSDSAVK